MQDKRQFYSRNDPLNKQHQQNLENLLAQKSEAIKNFNGIKPTVTRNDIQPMNSQNAHVLVGDKNKQVAVDVNPPSQNNRGDKRAVFDYDHNNNNNKRATYKFAGYTDKHDYQKVANYGESKFEQTHSNCSDHLKMIRQINNLTCNQIINEEEKEE